MKCFLKVLYMTTCYFLVGGHTVTPDNTVGVPFCYPV